MVDIYYCNRTDTNLNKNIKEVSNRCGNSLKIRHFNVKNHIFTNPVELHNNDEDSNDDGDDDGIHGDYIQHAVRWIFAYYY